MNKCYYIISDSVHNVKHKFFFILSDVKSRLDAVKTSLHILMHRTGMYYQQITND